MALQTLFENEALEEVPLHAGNAECKPNKLVVVNNLSPQTSDGTVTAQEIEAIEDMKSDEGFPAATPAEVATYSDSATQLDLAEVSVTATDGNTGSDQEEEYRTCSSGESETEFGGASDQSQAANEQLEMERTDADVIGSEVADTLGQMVASQTNKRMKRMSTVSIASSIVAIAPFIWGSGNDDILTNVPSIKTDAYDNIGPANDDRRKSRRYSWIKSGNNHGNNTRISMLMEHAAHNAKLASRSGNITSQTVEDWTSSLDTSFDSCLGNSGRFQLEMPTIVDVHFLNQQSKRTRNRAWARVSQLFFPGSKTNVSSSSIGSSVSSLSSSLTDVRFASPSHVNEIKSVLNPGHHGNEDKVGAGHPCRETHSRGDPDKKDETFQRIGPGPGYMEDSVLLRVSDESLPTRLGGYNQRQTSDGKQCHDTHEKADRETNEKAIAAEHSQTRWTRDGASLRPRSRPGPEVASSMAPPGLSEDSGTSTTTTESSIHTRRSNVFRLKSKANQEYAQSKKNEKLSHKVLRFFKSHRPNMA